MDNSLPTLSEVKNQIYNYAHKFIKVLPPESIYSFEDLVSEGVCKYYHCLSKFDSSKNTKFITYFTCALRNRFITILNKSIKSIKFNIDDIDILYSTDDNIYPENRNGELLLNEIQNPNEKFREILKLNGHKKRQKAIQKYFKWSDYQMEEAKSSILEATKSK